MKIDERYTTLDHHPIRCPHCESEEIRGRTMEQIDYLVLETKYTCADCGEVVGYWVCGEYDPELIVYKTNLYDAIRKFVRIVVRTIKPLPHQPSVQEDHGIFEDL